MKKIANIFIVVALAFSASLLQAQDVYTDNVVIVLDASGSMDESMRDAQGKSVRKIDAAKSGIYEVLNQIPDTTNIGVLAFSARGIRSEWVYPLGKKDEAKLRKALEPVEPSANTPLGTYMKIGADRLLQEREKQYNYGSCRLLVVTDGEANNEPFDRVDKFTSEIKARGITIDVIGVAMKSKHTLATKVNSYRAANDPASLKKAVTEVFAEVSSKKEDGSIGEEAFDVIAPIPNEVAIAMINALSNTGNHPIGEKPKPKPVVKTEIVQQPASPASQQTTPTVEPTAPQTTQEEEISCVLMGLICLAGVIILVIVFMIIKCVCD